MNLEEEILKANILIADDQPTNVKLLKKILNQAGYQNIFFTTQSDQVTKLYSEHAIDLLLLDIRMPQPDGFQIMEQLHKKLAHDDYLPILVLTAELATETRSRALSCGAKDFLTKPFDRQEVLQRIHNILEVRLMHKHIKHYNSDLKLEVKKRTIDLEESRLEIIQRLGRAAEYKDNETGNHILRMSKTAELLAKAIGMDDDYCEMILSAAPMHDIGKIGIPDRVLLKPDKLDADEWRIMKSHVNIGHDILSGSHSPLLKMAANIALAHHEKWDGSGYPQGLKGEDIPLEARICAISDVFDALTSERPYKKAWSVEDALQHIQQQRGYHFDPNLVDAFPTILDELLAFRSSHLDTDLKTPT